MGRTIAFSKIEFSREATVKTIDICILFSFRRRYLSCKRFRLNCPVTGTSRSSSTWFGRYPLRRAFGRSIIRRGRGWWNDVIVANCTPLSRPRWIGMMTASRSFVFVVKQRSNLFQSKLTRKTMRSQNHLRGKDAVKFTGCVVCGGRYSIDIKVR